MVEEFRSGRYPEYKAVLAVASIPVTFVAQLAVAKMSGDLPQNINLDMAVVSSCLVGFAGLTRTNLQANISKVEKVVRNSFFTGSVIAGSVGFALIQNKVTPGFFSLSDWMQVLINAVAARSVVKNAANLSRNRSSVSRKGLSIE